MKMFAASRCLRTLGPLILIIAVSGQAVAKEPSKTTFTREIPSTLPCPSGDITDNLTLNVMFQVFFDNAGNAIRTTTHVQLDEIFYNPATGKSVEGTAHYNYSDNGSAITLHGLSYALNIPGRGSTFLNAGKLVLDPNTGTVLYSTPHEMSGSLALICGAVE